MSGMGLRLLRIAISAILIAASVFIASPLAMFGAVNFFGRVEICLWMKPGALAGQPQGRRF